MATLPPSHHQECKKQWTRGVQQDERRTVACLWESHGSSRNLGLTFLLFSFQTPSLHLAVLLLIDQEAFSAHYRKILLLDL